MSEPTPNPFQSLFNAFGALFAPPPWLVHEMQHRVLLLVNHVLMQEDEAMARLARHQGEVVRLVWRNFQVNVSASRAGLLELAPADKQPELTVTIEDQSPFQILGRLAKGERPEVRIEGNVQLAGQVQWLADNVRWDLEEDVARIVGDGPAHTLGNVARRVAQALRSFTSPEPKA